MANTAFLPIEGIVQNITPMQNNCCQQMVSIRNSNGITNMIISTDTYVINETRLRSGMPVTAFYDGNAPVPLIFSGTDYWAKKCKRKYRCQLLQ